MDLSIHLRELKHETYLYTLRPIYTPESYLHTWDQFVHLAAIYTPEGPRKIFPFFLVRRKYRRAFTLLATVVQRGRSVLPRHEALRAITGNTLKMQTVGP